MGRAVWPLQKLDELQWAVRQLGGDTYCVPLGGGEGTLGGAEKRKKISFHVKGGSEGTLPGSRNAPFRAWGGSEGGGGVPSSHASSAVHLAPGEGLSRGGSTGSAHIVRAAHTNNHTQP